MEQSEAGLLYLYNDDNYIFLALCRKGTKIRAALYKRERGDTRLLGSKELGEGTLDEAHDNPPFLLHNFIIVNFHHNGLVILDKEDQVIRPALLWNDGRTYEECDYLNNVVVYRYTANIAHFL